MTESKQADLAAAALQVEAITAGYGRTTILRDVSLTVPTGRVIALLGPNGAGKTTLLRAVSGLIPLTRGRIVIDGRDITRRPAYARARLGLCHVPEGRGVFRSLSVRENLQLQVKPAEQAANVDRACAVFPSLSRRLDQLAGTLSGGEQQMLAMAAAYTAGVSLIVVDEASLGLAPRVVEEIFDFLQIATREGRSLLLVDQFVGRALALASTAHIMRQGQIVFSGDAAEIAAEDVLAEYLAPAVG